jgi:hypothetical protein
MAAQMGLTNLAAAIASGQSLSSQIDIGPGELVGILIPSGWTAANLTFQASPDGGTTWGNLFTYLGAEITFFAVAGQFLAVDPIQALLRGVRSLKLRSGTSGAPVVQGSAVTLTLITALI